MSSHSFSQVNIPKNQAYRLHFMSINFDELAPSGVSYTPTISIDDGGFASATNSVVHSGSGGKYIDLTASEMNGNKIVVKLAMTSSVLSNGSPVMITLFTDGYNPHPIPSASDVATAVWASGSRTLTSFGTLVADTASAVWSAVSRTLTDALTASDIWAYATRELTHGDNPGVANFSSNLLNFLVDAIQVAYDLVDFMLAQGDYNYYGVRHTNDDYLIVREKISDSSLSYAYKENNNGKKYDSAWTNHSALTYSNTQTKV